MKLIPIIQVIEHLTQMKSNIDLPEFDISKEKDVTYCVEWGIQKGEWLSDVVINRYISELQAQEVKPEITEEDMYLNMQYYYEYIHLNDYVTPQEWLKNHKHF